MRIGHGYDAHVYVEDRKLILGGVTIPYEKGLTAHSDGDAVIHALCDALLGAAALGDIGTYFPDTKAQFKDIDSRIILRQVFEMTNKNKLHIGNVDITILAEAPKLASFIPDMRSNIASDLEIEIGNVNIKATTTEGMGFVGRTEGVAVHAVVLLI
jgi:2-C-methyl-D-erythritol 2,4-cyclodiphosphate synthase